MIADRLQDFLEHFWNDQKCHQICTLGPRNYHKNTSKIQESYGSILDKYYLHIWESEILKMLEGLGNYLTFFKLFAYDYKVENGVWKLTFWKFDLLRK